MGTAVGNGNTTGAETGELLGEHDMETSGTDGNGNGRGKRAAGPCGHFIEHMAGRGRRAGDEHEDVAGEEVAKLGLDRGAAHGGGGRVDAEGPGQNILGKTLSVAHQKTIMWRTSPCATEFSHFCGAPTRYALQNSQKCKKTSKNIKKS